MGYLAVADIGGTHFRMMHFDLNGNAVVPGSANLPSSKDKLV